MGTVERSRAPDGPVHAADFADPFVLRTEGGYYAYATQVGDINVQVMASADLVRWEHLGNALPELPKWAAAGFTWSPSVLERDGRYVLFYTVRHREAGLQSISTAVADRPDGPFVDTSSAPFVFQRDRGGSIDPSPFVDTDGTAYLLWKSDDNAVQRPSSLWGCALAPDGLSLAGDPVRLLGHDRGWEAPLVEAPSMVRVEGTYFLFYSANWWESSRYAIGYATSEAPLGPCVKATRWRPWVAADVHAHGPGGQEFFTDTEGQLWMAFHAWVRGSVGYATGGGRALWLAKVSFTTTPAPLSPRRRARPRLQP
ncbi:MAG: glycoside hydrolase family 43 protein [Actinomycetota bacterium]|nr:glycoside hydrolase family 43 protein [Actinomycetota bacterium]